MQQEIGTKHAINIGKKYLVNFTQIKFDYIISKILSHQYADVVRNKLLTNHNMRSVRNDGTMEVMEQSPNDLHITPHRLTLYIQHATIVTPVY